MQKKITPEEHKTCLYWSKEKADCILTKRGVFIPTHDHIDIYCSTSNFYKCHHYISSRELTEHEKITFAQTLEDNRRFFHRKRGDYSVKLESCDEEGKPTGLFEAEAHTVDLSAGGMRLATTKEIPRAGHISFKFGEDFFIPDFSGFGEVKWSGQNGADTYQAGVSFVENRVKRAIGAHIGFI